MCEIIVYMLMSQFSSFLIWQSWLRITSVLNNTSDLTDTECQCEEKLPALPFTVLWNSLSIWAEGIKKKKHIWQWINLKKLSGAFDVQHLKPLEKWTPYSQDEEKRKKLNRVFTSLFPLIFKMPQNSILLISVLCSRWSALLFFAIWTIFINYRGIWLARLDCCLPLLCSSASQSFPVGTACCIQKRGAGLSVSLVLIRLIIVQDTRWCRAVVPTSMTK